MNRKALLLITIFVEGGLVLLGLILMRFSQLELWSKFHLSWAATASTLLLCVPMLAALFFAMRTQWTPLSRLRNELEEKVIPIFANSKLPDLALIAFLAGAGEELFFRGWLQGALTSNFGIWLGVLIASVIFGLAHYLSITYALYAGLTGLYLGVIYQVTGNLYIVMAIHALYDFIALVYMRGSGNKTELSTLDDVAGN
jgi:membrane protease YdiL (CAAX protease family)